MTTTTAVIGAEPTFALTSSGGPATSTGHRRGAAAVDDHQSPPAWSAFGRQPTRDTAYPGERTRPQS
jgi:hypothetical protein